MSGLAGLIGWACVLIGAGHLVGGSATVPGEANTGATVDSRERFYGDVFAGYGMAWVWAGRQQPVPDTVVIRLCGVMSLGAVGRLVSRATRGRPHWFQDVLTIVEVVLPAAVLLMLVTQPDPAALGDRQRENDLSNQHPMLEPRS